MRGRRGRSANCPSSSHSSARAASLSDDFLTFKPTLQSAYSSGSLMTAGSASRTCSRPRAGRASARRADRL